jgi:hypothetical protein
MTPVEILAGASARGFKVSLNPAGDGLILWPGNEPPADLVALIKGAKPLIVAALQAERGRNRWIANQLIDWSTSCLHCRKPIVAGQLWAIVANGEVSARFHEACHAEWLVERETLARRAGLAEEKC